MTLEIRKSSRFLQCGCGDEYGERSVDVGRITFGVCETCKKFWHVSDNLSSRWKDEQSELGREAAEIVWSERYGDLKARYKQVDYGEVERYSQLTAYGQDDAGYHAQSYEEQLLQTPLHPALSLIPEVSECQFAVLKESIKRNGQRLEIPLWQGQIVDGRARLRAAIELERCPAFCELSDYVDPYEFALDMNLARKQFSPEQVADVQQQIKAAEVQINAFRVVASVERYPESIPF